VDILNSDRAEGRPAQALSDAITGS